MVDFTSLPRVSSFHAPHGFYPRATSFSLIFIPTSRFIPRKIYYALSTRHVFNSIEVQFFFFFIHLRPQNINFSKTLYCIKETVKIIRRYFSIVKSRSIQIDKSHRFRCTIFVTKRGKKESLELETTTNETLSPSSCFRSPARFLWPAR